MYTSSILRHDFVDLPVPNGNNNAAHFGIILAIQHDKQYAKYGCYDHFIIRNGQRLMLYLCLFYSVLCKRISV